MSATVLSAPPARTGTRRSFEYLDSVRGLAALMVMMYHFARGFCDLSGELWETPLGVVLSGHYGVQIFFALSGFVLSLSFFRTFNRDVLTSAATRRYFRLMLPVLASLLIACGLQHTVGYHHRAAADRMEQAEDAWLRKGAKKTLSLQETVTQGVYGTFFDYNGDKSINTSLWTMRIELFGSLFVFGFLALCGPIPRRYLIYPILLWLLLETNKNWFTFLLGVMLCDLYTTLQRRGKPLSLPFWGALLVILIALFLGGLDGDWVKKEFGFKLIYRKDWMRLGAALLLFGVLASPVIQKLLRWQPLVTLGKLSFSIYLLHWPVMISVGSLLYLKLRDRGWEHTPAVVLMWAVFTLLTFAGAWFLHRYVDEPSIRIGRWIEGWFSGSKKLPPPNQMS